jgi:hypothetical protein
MRKRGVVGACCSAQVTLQLIAIQLRISLQRDTVCSKKSKASLGLLARFMLALAQEFVQSEHMGDRL